MASQTTVPAAPEGTAPGVDLPPLADTMLASGDVDGYRALLVRAEALTDPHRRHWALLHLIEQGLLAGSAPAELRAGELLAATAEGALTSLERQPSEPVLLSLCGATLGRLGALDGARALTLAARRLDPDMPGLAEPLAELGARADGARGPTGISSPSVSTEELARRALQIAERAQPARGLTMSLCMIVRDEEEMLPRCLAAIAGVVDEIVIVDTGSRDATLDIARSFDARVISRPWRNSFAEARNASFDAAGGDWLVYLDADEVLLAEDAPMLPELTGRIWREAFYLSETNHTGELAHGTSVSHRALRVFRNRPEYRFEGRVHEQIAKRLPGFLPERVEVTAIRVEHFGYLGSMRARRDKSGRNIELLRLQEAEGPPDAFLLFNLGSEQAAAGEDAGAARDFERAWAAMLEAPEHESREFGPALASRLVRTLRACGRAGDAFALAEQALDRYPGFTDLVFEQALAAVSLGQATVARELLERCIEMGDAPARYPARAGAGGPLARVALADVLSGQADHAAAAATLAAIPDGDPLALQARRGETIARLAGGGPLPDGLLERGREVGLGAGELELFAAWQELCLGEAAGRSCSQAVVAPLSSALETLLGWRAFEAFELLLGLLERTPMPARERRELLGEMYLRNGFSASAADEWMAVCREQPDARALVGLARVAVANGMPREAEEFAASALAHDPASEAATLLLAQAQAQLSQAVA